MKFSIALGFIFSLSGLSPLYGETLKWAADTESGAPYVFLDPQDPEKLIGFEWDIIQEIGRILGEKVEFVQNQWDSLIPGLQAGNYDLVINGIEITDDRKNEINFSNPYYLTSEELTVRKDVYSINGLADLSSKAVGTLAGSLAERILREYQVAGIRPYESESAAYGDLENGRINAVLLDQPIAIYYAHPRKQLKSVGGPIGRMFYGIGIRKSDKVLLERVNNALGQMIQNGSLREILESWNLWTPVMAEYLNDHRPLMNQPNRYLDFLAANGMKESWLDKLKHYGSLMPLLAQGAWMTLKISFASMFIALLAGLLLVLLRLYGNKAFSLIATLAIEFLRGTPLLIQLLLIYYGLPHIGIHFSPFLAAIIGLGLNYGAYEAENYRAGIQAIPQTQHDSAYSLGLSRMQSFRYIVLPQAFRIVLPSITNDFISLLKDSSLVSVITMVELTKTYGQLASTYFDYLGIGIVTAILYLIIGLPFVRLSRWVENTLNYSTQAKSGGPNLFRLRLNWRRREA